MSLYARLLGEEWERVDPAVRRIHEGVSTGVFRVTWGSPWARLFRLPAPADRCPVRLVVTATDTAEEWHRTFDRQVLVTRQWAAPDGLLAEQHGPLTLCFRLQVHQGALLYEQAAARIGPVRLPRLLQPRIRAREAPAPEGVHVRVEVVLPLLGPLLTYEGWITR